MHAGEPMRAQDSQDGGPVMIQGYEEGLRGLEALIEGDTDWLTDLSNASALLNEVLPRVNWVGFYLQRAGRLRLGPFQGKAACVEIPSGKGVCGAAVQRGETVVVADVHRFPGHIACDAASRSEIVVPILMDGQVYGVLDVDSPFPNRFHADDRAFLEGAVRVLIKHVDWQGITSA